MDEKDKNVMEYNKVYNMNCFDCFNAMDNDSVDYVITSPPYNRKRNDKYAFYNDQLSDYYKFLEASISECIRIARRYVFYNIQTNYYNASDVYKIIGKFADMIKQVIIWAKTNPMPANGNNVTNSYEYILVFGKNPLKANHTYTKNIILTSVNSDMPKEHKAVMKYDVADWLIKSFTEENTVIFDPFFGTGTTGVACIKNNRYYIGIELVQQYIDIANDRLLKCV